MSFRILNQAPQYLLADGSVNAGGSLTFYATDLTTPKNTWSNAAKTVLNPNPVVLDAAGRSNTDIWGDGEYGVVCKDALGVVQWTRNNVRDASGSSTTIPALQTGKFLTNDGAVLQWETVVQVPDMTGESGNILSNDGANPTWIPPPVAPPASEMTGTERVVIRTGGDTDWMIQKGTGTAPASGLNQSSLAVTFPQAFKTGTIPSVSITPSPGTQPGGPVVPYVSAAPTAAGFTAVFDVAEGNSGDQNILNPIVFQWIAQGAVDAP